MDRLWSLYQRRDFLSIARSLPPVQATETPHLRIVRGETLAAFGLYTESNAVLLTVLPTLHDAYLMETARERLMRNYRALFDYRAALWALHGLPPTAAVQESAAFLDALKNVPRQTIGRPDTATDAQRDRYGRISALLNGHAVHLLLDTAANVSVISQSAARGADLHLLAAAHRLRSATGTRVRSGIATGTLVLGRSVKLANVVFLVVPDKSLKISRGQSADGALGFPVLSQVGAMQFQRDSRVTFGALNPRAATRIAIIEGDPAIEVLFGTSRLICRIDSGSNRTSFVRSPSPMAARKAAASKQALRTLAGAERIYTAILPAMHLTVAGRQISIAAPLLQPELRNGNPYIDCNLGQDSLQQIEPYTIDLGRMTISSHGR